MSKLDKIFDINLAFLFFTYIPTIIMALAVSFDIDPNGTSGAFAYPVYVWGAYVAISLIVYVVYQLRPEKQVTTSNESKEKKK